MTTEETILKEIKSAYTNKLNSYHELDRRSHAILAVAILFVATIFTAINFTTNDNMLSFAHFVLFLFFMIFDIMSMVVILFSFIVMKPIKDIKISLDNTTSTEHNEKNIISSLIKEYDDAQKELIHKYKEKSEILKCSITFLIIGAMFLLVSVFVTLPCYIETFLSFEISCQDTNKLADSIINENLTVKTTEDII